MTNGQPIVCGVDATTVSHHAAAVGLMLSRALQCPLVLVHVVPQRPAMPLASVPIGGRPVATADMAELDQIESDAAFKAAAEALGYEDHQRIVERGHVVDRLSTVADSHDARLIVVGTRGMGATRSALLGSVSQDLAANASRPVVAVPPPRADASGTGTGIGPGPVVCGVDGSEGSRAAAEVALRLAGDLGAALTLASVRSSRATRDERGLLPVTDFDVAAENPIERLAIIGDPADELARVAADRRAALLVVGSRGRGSVRAALLGSVSAALTRHAGCPVVIVPRGAAEHGAPLDEVR